VTQATLLREILCAAYYPVARFLIHERQEPFGVGGFVTQHGTHQQILHVSSQVLELSTQSEHTFEY